METINQINANLQLCNFKSVEEANVWLASQNNIIVKRMSVDTSGSSHKVYNIALQFIAYDRPVGKKFQITEYKKTRLFVKSKEEKVRREWQERNPQFNYVLSSHKIWAFRLIGGHVGYFKLLKEIYIILYSFDNNF